MYPTALLHPEVHMGAEPKPAPSREPAGRAGRISAKYPSTDVGAGVPPQCCRA